MTPNETLKARRERLDLTITDVAEQVGVSTAYLCALEHGTRIPSRQVAKLWADLLYGHSVSFLRMFADQIASRAVDRWNAS